MAEPGGGAYSPTLSPDELTLYFASSRTLETRCASMLDDEIWQANRATTADPFAHPRPIAELSTHRPEWPSWLSPDGCRLYFTRQSARSDADLYVAEKARPPCSTR
jgi:dipeptidyl aminopeptidase/acylaminoacyl peptidase